MEPSNTDTAQSTLSMGNQDVMELVSRIVETIQDTTYAGFIEASRMFNSQYFDGESEFFRSRMCSALLQKFPQHVNLYWKEFAL